MEDTQRKKHKKKDKKPLYLLLGFLIFFGIFIYVLTRPSLQSKAIGQIQVCSNVNDVKSLYERYKFDLLETDENGNKIVALEFQDAVRNKLSSFNLNEVELGKCLEWIPPSKTSLNIIVIPDLSRRITDTIENPRQIENDLIVLNTIWNSFVEYSKLKQDTKDKLIVDVTDIDQAKGQFSSIANQLQFDLSTHKGKSNRLYFTQAKNKQFNNAVVALYKSAKEKPLGADYIFYFRRYLVNHLKKPTLYDNYINKVVIITDGYLELEKRQDYGGGSRWNYTEINNPLYSSVNIGNIKNTITSLSLNIPKLNNIDLKYTDILVCEVNERKTGKTKDFEILKAYWEDWFERMNANKDKISFIQREQANEITKTQINEFFKK
ncbi:hypothetical protein [Flavobacterium sp. PL12]|jgi:hypothetical protein|uniref:hypothetical protein n=1 Tax=Flavobacterium sp. PL12 TaxID=3071718 RepID=UPI00319E1CC5